MRNDQFGNDCGNRIDYPLTADAETRVITIAPSFLTPANSFHLYGLALR